MEGDYRLAGREAGEKEEQQKITADIIAADIDELIRGIPGADLPYGKKSAGLEKKTKTKKSRKGVRITIRDNSVRVYIQIVVGFGKPIPEIARSIQRKVKDLINRVFPDYQIAAINIQVTGVRFNGDSARYRKEAVEALDEPRGPR